MLSDIEIAQQATLRPIADVANELGITNEELEPYGRVITTGNGCCCLTLAKCLLISRFRAFLTRRHFNTDNL